ncbi:uncharacterized protein LOC143288851 [Babylonia areolata]|uniref:uncharacterized protein LOC143288851 n=1 Tax=Babylonia areolata TaxID=304850 RepID=UPI003FD3D7C1
MTSCGGTTCCGRGPARSRVECGLTCLRDARCVLYSVSPGTGGAAGTCRTHSKRLPPAARREVVSGARTFSPVTTDNWNNKVCVSDHDCTDYMTACFSGKCLCDGGFFYDVNLNGCVSTCTRGLGDSYTAYPDIHLNQTSAWISDANGSVSSCTPLCNANPGCTGFNFGSGWPRCYFKYGTPQDYPVIRFSGTVKTFYQRTCA